MPLTNLNGISFEVAAPVFEDPNYVLRGDRVGEDNEERWHAIGIVNAVLLLGVHVYRSIIDGEEVTRIISARKANEHEGRGYFQ